MEQESYLRYAMDLNPTTLCGHFSEYMDAPMIVLWLTTKWNILLLILMYFFSEMYRIYLNVSVITFSTIKLFRYEIFFHIFVYIWITVWIIQTFCILQAAGKSIKYSHLLSLFQQDQLRGSTGLSVVPKLRPVHLSPNSFQKMNVKLAVQVGPQCVHKYIFQNIHFI